MYFVLDWAINYYNYIHFRLLYAKFVDLHKQSVARQGAYHPVSCNT